MGAQRGWKYEKRQEAGPEGKGTWYLLFFSVNSLYMSNICTCTMVRKSLIFENLGWGRLEGNWGAEHQRGD